MKERKHPTLKYTRIEVAKFGKELSEDKQFMQSKKFMPLNHFNFFLGAVPAIHFTKFLL
jgi:hypothetical protein